MHSGFRVKTQAEREEEEKAERRKAKEKDEARRAQTFEVKGSSLEPWTEAQIEERILAVGATPKETAHILRVYISRNSLLTRMPPRVLTFTHCTDLSLMDNGITSLATSPHLFAMTWLRSLTLVWSPLLLVIVFRRLSLVTPRVRQPADDHTTRN